MELVHKTAALGLTLEKIRNMSTPASFSKGRSYYNNDSVGVIRNVGYIFIGKVKGTQYYNVTLQIESGEILIDCDCLYGDEYDGICKHCVAFALAVLDGKYEESSVKSNSDNKVSEMEIPKFSEYYKNIETKKKLSFLRQLLSKNKDLQTQFIAFTKSESSDLDKITCVNIDELRKEIFEDLSTLDFNDLPDNYNSDYYDYRGYNDYEGYDESANEMIRNVLEIYSARALNFLKNGNSIDAFRVILAMFEGSQGLPELDCDEYAIFDGEYNSSVQDILKEEINKISQELTKNIISDSNIQNIIDIFDDRVQNYLLINNELEEDSIPYNLLILENLFLALITNKNTADYFFNVIRKNELDGNDLAFIILKIAEVKKDENLWLEYAEKFSNDNKVIIRQLIEKYKSLGDKKNFITKVKIAFTKWKDDFDEYILRNIDKILNQNLYINGLKNYTIRKKSISHYIELREYLTTDERIHYVDNAENKDSVFYVLLLEVEERYSEILDFVNKHKNDSYDYGFNQYIHPILNIYPEECFEILRDKCNKAVDSQGRDRRTYQTITGWLKLLFEIKTKKSETSIIIASLFNHKPNLPALRDEIKKAGFVIIH